MDAFAAFRTAASATLFAERLRYAGSAAPRARGDRAGVLRRRAGARRARRRWRDGARGGLQDGRRRRCRGDARRRSRRSPSSSPTRTRGGHGAGRAVGRGDRAAAAGQPGGDVPDALRALRRRGGARDRARGAAGADAGAGDHRARASAHRPRRWRRRSRGSIPISRRACRSSSAMRCHPATCGSPGTTARPRATLPRCGSRWRRSLAPAGLLRAGCERSGRRSMATDMELAELADTAGSQAATATHRAARASWRRSTTFRSRSAPCWARPRCR